MVWSFSSILTDLIDLGKKTIFTTMYLQSGDPNAKFDYEGELDEDAIVGGSVYVDPRQRYGTLFVAVNNNVPLTKDDLIYTNDPEKAKAHAES